MAKTKQIILFLVFVILFGCAKKLPPSGGPVDNIPPEIINSFPTNKTVNFNQDYFEFGFSEYVDKNSFRNSFFISPEIKITEYDWSGTSIRLLFNDSLKKNTTYLISISTELVDLANKNKMDSFFNISFSTGNIIDNGIIDGNIFANDFSNIKIIAYKKDNWDLDFTKTADFITLPNLKGFFTLNSLKKSDYYIFAIKDNNSNNKYDFLTEAISIPSQVFSIKDSIAHQHIKFELTQFDTIKSSISEIVMTDKHHIQIEFSKLTDSSKVKSNNFLIYDSTANKRIPIKYAYKGNSRKEKMMISFSDSLKTENNNFLISENINDYFGNISDKEITRIYVNEKSDTTKPKIIKWDFITDNKIDFLNPKFRLLFDDGIDETSLLNSISILNKKGKQLNFNLTKINDADFEVYLTSELAQKEKINIQVQLSNLFDAANNYGDSLQTKEIETLTSLDFVSLSGNVLGNSTQNIFVILKNLTSNKLYKTKVINQTYKFDRILPDKYQIFAFADLDKNNNCNKGKIHPFDFSEPFTFLQDTINVRPRWPITDINLDFN